MNYNKFNNFNKFLIPFMKKKALKCHDFSRKTYCDDCESTGKGAEHQSDCWYKRAQDAMTAIKELESLKKMDFHKGITNKNRKELLAYKKFLIISKIFIKDFGNFMPLDYNDPSNQSVVCSCHYLHKNSKVRKHHKNCEIVKISKAVQNLYK